MYILYYFKNIFKKSYFGEKYNFFNIIETKFQIKFLEKLH